MTLRVSGPSPGSLIVFTAVYVSRELCTTCVVHLLFRVSLAALPEERSSMRDDLSSLVPTSWFADSVYGSRAMQQLSGTVARRYSARQVMIEMSITEQNGTLLVAAKGMRDDLSMVSSAGVGILVHQQKFGFLSSLVIIDRLLNSQRIDLP